MASSHRNGLLEPWRLPPDPPGTALRDRAAFLVQQYGSGAVVLAIEEVYRCLDHGSRHERVAALALLNAVEQALAGSRGNRRARQ